MKKLLLLSFVFIVIASCNNDINSDILESTNSNETISSKVINSVAKESYLSKCLLLECEGYSSISRSQEDFCESFINDYDLSTQQVITSNKKEGTVYLVSNKRDSTCFLAFYKDSNDNILNIKKISIKKDRNSDYVSFYRLDGSEFISICGNIENRNLKILSYDQSVFSSVQTRNGCSICIGIAGIPWSTGLGMVNPLAGIACSFCFMVMSEALY